MSRFRFAFLIVALVALGSALVACGGDGGGSSDEDAQQVLDRTFSGDHPSVKSGKIDVSLSVSAEGEEDGIFDVSLSGPFQGEEGKLPKFDFTATASGEGGGESIDFEGALISTGDAGFVSYQGTDYEVDAQTFSFFKSAVEQAQARSEEQAGTEDDILGQLGIKPQNWATNLTNEGTEDVEGDETVHISGDIDVGRLLDDFGTLAEQAGSLGLSTGGQVPSAEELDQLASAVKDATFELYTGTEDDILRRFRIDLALVPPDGPDIDIGLEFTLSELNEEQSIEAPSDTRPLNDLLRELGIGELGSLGGLGGPAGPGGTSGPPSGAEAQEYLNCIAEASTPAELQRCNSLVG